MKHPANLKNYFGFHLPTAYVACDKPTGKNPVKITLFPVGGY
jgi:hypothetical protein